MVRNTWPENVGQYVDLVMTSLTAQMENPRRPRGNSGVGRALQPVITTVDVPVAFGINMVGSRTEEHDRASHRNGSSADMVLTGSPSAKHDNETQQVQMSASDPREQLQVIKGVHYAAPISFDDILPEEYRRIPTIPWLSHWAAVLTDAESRFAVLEHYAWVGEFFGGASVDALSLQVCLDIITVYEADLSFQGWFDSKRVRHVSEDFKGLSSLPNSPVIEGDMDVYLWPYRTYGERTYVTFVLCRQSVCNHGEAGTSFMPT